MLRCVRVQLRRKGYVRGGQRSVRAFTLVEMLVVFLLSSIVLGLFFDMFYSGSLRFWGVMGRIEGEQAIRILLARLRHELKTSVGLVDISKQGRQLTIPLINMMKTTGDDSESAVYFMQYEYEPVEKSILVRRLDASGTVVNQRLWLGGRAPIENFICFSTSENDRILFQYYRVIIEVDYFDIKLRDKIKAASDGGGRRKLIHATCTVYPRRINMELRIEVPQEGGTL